MSDQPTTAEERAQWKHKCESDPGAWMAREKALRLIADVESLQGRHQWWRDHFERAANSNASIIASLHKKVEAGRYAAQALEIAERRGYLKDTVTGGDADFENYIFSTIGKAYDAGLMKGGG